MYVFNTGVAGAGGRSRRAVSTHHGSGNEDTKQQQRTGVLAMKVGMLPVWDAMHQRHNCTVLQVEENVVIQQKTVAKHGYSALVIGGGRCKAKHVQGTIKGQYKHAQTSPKRVLQEFRVSPNALLNVGTSLQALHFVPGQYVDVCGKSIGKGFQGTMKKHNFAGQPASHGNSKTHRHLGSTGQCQDPGRVFKGKKMPGKLGAVRVTRDNLQVIKIDPIRNLLYVKGSVPGHKGNIVRVTDARKKRHQFTSTEDDLLSAPLPFPTFFAEELQEQK